MKKIAGWFKKYISELGLHKPYWRRINISKKASKVDLSRAVKAAKAHGVGRIKSMPFTENNPEWVLLYEHISKGQITPWAMRNMKRNDLYYLAGLTFPHPALAKAENEKKLFFEDPASKRWEQLTKIQGNAIRAQEELRYRNFVWATFFVVLAAFIGAFAAWGLPFLTKI